MKPRVSVIVPLYNKVAEVQRAIDSIFAQTTQDFELVIVGGGSTDGSLDVIKKYENDSRYHLIHQVSKGVSGARNEGISSASAEFITFLDADDAWLPQYLETIMKLNEKYPKAGIFATAYYIDNPQKNNRDMICCSDVTKTFEGLLPSYYHAISTGPHPIITPGVGIPKSILNQIGGFDEKLSIGEDLDLWARIALYHPVAYSATPLWIYYIETSNNHLSTAKNKEIIEIPFLEYIQKNAQDSAQLYESGNNISLYIAYLYILQAQELVYVGNKKMARMALTQAKHQEIFFKKIGFWMYINLPRKYFKILLKITGKFTKIGQTL